MEPNVRLFLDCLNTAADIEAAYQVLRDAGASECDQVFAAYANSKGFNFTVADARRWLATFVESINDSELRSRWKMSRLRHINDWAAFLALERELKITIPDESFIGNPWQIDSEEHQDENDGKLASSFVTRWINFCLGRK